MLILLWTPRNITPLPGTENSPRNQSNHALPPPFTIYMPVSLTYACFTALCGTVDQSPMTAPILGRGLEPQPEVAWIRNRKCPTWRPCPTPKSNDRQLPTTSTRTFCQRPGGIAYARHMSVRAASNTYGCEFSSHFLVHYIFPCFLLGA